MTQKKRLIYPDFVLKRIGGLYNERLLKGYSRRYVSEQTGLPMQKVATMEYGSSLPDKASYNKLARLFSWEEWE